MHGNYEYSLTSEQQSALQVFLRLAVPDKLKWSKEYQLLHELTYAKSWTPEPQHDTLPIDAKIMGFAENL